MVVESPLTASEFYIYIRFDRQIFCLFVLALPDNETVYTLMDDDDVYECMNPTSKLKYSTYQV